MSPLNNVAIIGAGPIGLILANYLKKSGSNIFLFDKDKVKVNLIKNEGITIQQSDKKEILKLKHVFSDFQEADANTIFEIAIFCTKAYQTDGAGKTFKNHFGVIPVLSAQNGIETENILKNIFGENNVLRMVINFAGNLLAPNQVKQTFFIPPNYIASIDDSKRNLAKNLAQQLTSVELETRDLDSFSILKQIWEKTILNSALSALCGISKMTMKEVMSQPDMVEIVEQTIQEAVEVAAAEKIFFDDDFIRKCIRYLKKAGDHYPSLAIDMMNGRETEIDFFNGKILQYGRKHYIKTPMNQMFYNIVKAQTQKSIPNISFLSIQNNYAVKSSSKKADAYLGIDLGSSYTKIAVIDTDNQILFKTILKTFNRDKISIHHVIDTVQKEYNIQSSCATGYGRKYFTQSDIVKTEINCAARGVNIFIPGEKTIIDIGGEDIKIIKCDKQGLVENFSLNDKCAAGTGSFIVEIAEKTGLDIKEMNDLAKHSTYNKPLNSFCTVFAKTEIMNWIFEGMSVQDIARGIYLSIASRVGKMRIDTTCPVVLIGGVSAYHPYFREILENQLKTKIYTLDHPQHIVAIGAALMAKDYISSPQTQNA
ncbi:MAG: hypothetical protein KatS3mg027_0952 [Bacteroidia bacterium]|nr:MAG: hypothetical protein KatS3mg027_0952 [Bacteroidia bacterium]